MRMDAGDRMADSRLRICLVAHNAYGALAGGNGGHLEDVERELSLMATANVLSMCW